MDDDDDLQRKRKKQVPREEQDWTSSFDTLDPSIPLVVVGENNSHTTPISNDWRERLAVAERLLTTAAASAPGRIRMTNFDDDNDNDNDDISLAPPKTFALNSLTNPIIFVPAAVPGRRNRGRPRKYPQGAPERSSQALKVSARYAADLRLLSQTAAAIGGDGGGVTLQEHYRFFATSAAPESYDMDEEDFAWLSNCNSQRAMISADAFEAVMDGLEKGWHRLTRPLARYAAKCDEAAFPDDMACAVCGLIDSNTIPATTIEEISSSSNNLMIICEGCDVAVHQDCYGVVHIPEGPWLCRRCQLSKEAAQCALCPWPGGALKPTTQPANPKRSWTHLLCARMLPAEEVLILNPVYQEPVEIGGIDPDRWNLICTYCRRPRGSGAPMQCAEVTCRVAFHPLCARAVSARMDVAGGWAYCWRHSAAGEGSDNINSAHSNQSPAHLTVQIPPAETSDKRHSRIHLLTHPRAPKALLQELSQTCHLPYAQVALISRYWALKRAARRGQALLRSLQLEPWTSGGEVGRLETGNALLSDFLPPILTLTETVLKRERLRVGSLSRAVELMDLLLDPLRGILNICINELYSFDSSYGFFRLPVDPIEVPDYYDIVKEPVWIEKIAKRSRDSLYSTFDQFARDVRLIWSNATLYNAPTTVYYRAAEELRIRMDPILCAAQESLEKFPQRRPTLLIRVLEALLPAQPLRASELRHGMLIWAKISDSCVLPGRVVYPSRIPKKASQMPPQRPTRKGVVLLESYYDATTRWVWVRAGKDTLVEVGEDFNDDLQRIALLVPKIDQVDRMKSAHYRILQSENKKL